MENELINLIKDISYPALIVLAILIFNKAGFWNLLSDFLRSKINGKTDPTIHEKLKEIKSNDLHEISKTLERIEKKLDKLDEVENLLIRIDTKLNSRDK